MLTFKLNKLHKKLPPLKFKMELFLFWGATIIFSPQSWRLPLILIPSIVLHEYGHIFGAYRCGIRAVDVQIGMFGGVASISGTGKTPYEELYITLCGPVVNLLIAVPAMFFDWTKIYEINLVLFCFNILIPAIPMDGGRILRSFLWMVMSKVKATKISVVVAYCACILLFIYGVYSLNFIMAGIAILIAGMAYTEKRNVIAQDYRDRASYDMGEF